MPAAPPLVTARLQCYNRRVGDETRIRIVLADDHPLYRSSVVRAILHHPRLQVVAQSADGRSALAEIRRQLPDVALLDVRMPELDGEAVLNAVVRDGLPTRVMLISGALGEGDVYRALENGAAAILTKGVDADALVDAILAVARGETVVAPDLQAAVASQIRLRGGESGALLTRREQEVLELIAEGASGPDIAAQLSLSASTIKTHTEKLYRKLGVTDRAAAVAEAMRRGVLQ
jgi:two-component system nitrate/nitrite response regulator NarL